MKKIAFITGILGQDGPYLAKLLLERDYRVYGMMRRYAAPHFDNLEYLGIADQVEYVTGDMSDENSLTNLIRTIKPAEVYNLAAQSFVGASWDLATSTTYSNALGPLFLLNAIKHFAPNARYYQAATSEMFGNNSELGKQTEQTAFHPRSPYAISKLYAYWITVNYRESYGLHASNGILFNHESPLRGKEFVTRKITDGVARIKLGLADSISLGNLDSVRDWGFAGDYVEAMWLMLQQDEPGDFLVSTGVSHSVRDFLDIAFRRVGIEAWEQYVRIDPRYKRPAELHSLQGVSSKTATALGWKPKVVFEDLVHMMVDADMQRLSPKA